MTWAFLSSLMLTSRYIAKRIKDKSTLRRLVISNFSKEVTETVLQIIHDLFPLYVPFGTKRQ